MLEVNNRKARWGDRTEETKTRKSAISISLVERASTVVRHFRVGSVKTS